MESNHKSKVDTFGYFDVVEYTRLGRQFIYCSILIRYCLFFLDIVFRFVVKDRVTTYSSAQRSLIVMQILLRVKFDDTDKVSYLKLKFYIFEGLEIL